MRIAYLTQSYPPMISGAARAAQQLAESMACRGHQILVIAASDQEYPYCSQDGNLTVLRLASVHNPLRVGQRFLLYPRREIRKALDDFQPELIHTHEPTQMGWLGIGYARRTHIPIALTAHQLPGFVASYLPPFFRRYAERLLWMYARQLAPKFTTIITPTKTISTLVAASTRCPASTISYGLDLQAFHPPFPSDDNTAMRQRWNLPLDVPLLLHVGRLDPDKRVERVIQAAAQTMKENPAHLVMVGDGTRKPALVELCRLLGITHRVHFTGYISAGQGLPDIYRMAALFVTASEIETQGVVLLEAAASGLPIVAVNATCIPEIVHDGVNGILAEPGDLNGLSTAMSLLLQDKQKAARMGKASRVLAAQHEICFTLDAYENLYLKMVQWEFTVGPAPAGRPICSQ